MSQDVQPDPVRQSVGLTSTNSVRDVERGEGPAGIAAPRYGPRASRLESPMHDQGTPAPARSQAGSSGGSQLVTALQELRAGIAEAEQRIDRLMVMRRRELAGLRPVPDAEPADPEVTI